MKYVLVAGLEHSGTTLLTHLLSQREEVLGLGEIYGFFSPDHMKDYMETWGGYSDVRLCSCGEDWRDCEFWRGITGLNGLESNASMKSKYQSLVDYVSENFKACSTIVDSSGMRPLDLIMGHGGEIGIKTEDVLVIYAIKDVRSFAASIAKKTGNRSLISYLRTFNWWLCANKQSFDALKVAGVASKVVLYEKLCNEPELIVSEILDAIGTKTTKTGAPVSPAHNHSHIAMGNKDFYLRNRKRIRYDYRWFSDDMISLAYCLHRRARKYNKSLYDETIPG